MPIELNLLARVARPAIAGMLGLLLAGCAAPRQELPAAPAAALPAPAGTPAAGTVAMAAEPPPVGDVAAAAPAPAAPSTALPPPLLSPAQTAADQVLAYADRIRPLSAVDLAAEIQRLGDSSYTPVRAVQLAVALLQARTPAQLPRAQALLQRVLGQRDAEAQALHALARLLGSQVAEQRRHEEHAERQAQQLREAHRRVEQLNDRLEAVRAIERSLPTRPRREAPAARRQAD